MPARTAKRKAIPAQDFDLELLMELMAIPGKSGEEAEVARYLTERLVEAGAKSSWIRHDQAHRATPRRPLPVWVRSWFGHVWLSLVFQYEHRIPKLPEQNNLI